MRSGRCPPTSPLERLNREVKRRTDVADLPNPAALLRLSNCVLIEAHDEWQDDDRRYLSEEPMALLKPPVPTLLEPRTDTPDREDPKGVAAYGIVALLVEQHATSCITPGTQSRESV